MNSSILARDVRSMGIIAAMLAATLAAMLAIFVLAKPSEAADPILTIRPSSVDFGSVTVDADTETRTITVENNGLIDLKLGGVKILGVDSGAFDVEAGLANGLIVEAGETATFTVSFDPVKTGLQTAELTFNSVTNTLGQTVGGIEAPTVNLTGQGVSTNPSGSGCTITGGPNSETLRGTPRKDVICARGGNDTVRALRGNDTVRGGGGNDVVRSSKGRDTLTGGAGADRLTDKAGRDRLIGQGGKDTLNAKDGKRGDLLVGGPRRDKAFKDRGDKARSI
jgi:Ca2+-binding RTX toxin-like protein